VDGRSGRVKERSEELKETSGREKERQLINVYLWIV
jgi:hypothetical protein